MRPPYSEPTQIAAIRTSEDSGGRPKANATGTGIATALMGPWPGSTPTMVPTKEPMVARNRLVGLRATPKASRQVGKSLHQSSLPSKAARQHDSKDAIKQQVRGNRDDPAGQQALPPFGAEEHGNGDHQKRGGKDEAERLEKQGMGQKADRETQQGPVDPGSCRRDRAPAHDRQDHAADSDDCGSDQGESLGPDGFVGNGASRPQPKAAMSAANKSAATPRVRSLVMWPFLLRSQAKLGRQRVVVGNLLANEGARFLAHDRQGE